MLIDSLNPNFYGNIYWIAINSLFVLFIRIFMLVLERKKLLLPACYQIRFSTFANN